MNENGDTFDTRAWLVEHFHHPDTARISFLATLRLECCVVCSISMLYNECVRD